MIKQKYFLILIIIMAFTITGVSAINCGDLPINASNSVFSIQWNYNVSDGITSMSLDGREIDNFDNQSGFFILNRIDGEGTTFHTIRIANEANSGCNTSAFLPEPISQSETFFTTINLWILFIIALVCIVIGIAVPIVAICGAVFSIVGFIGAFNHSFALGFVFVVTLIASLIVGLSK
jgi:hypothetical protein